uniref:TATA-box binding protein associated factor 4b n=1 Tax=Aquila chrysaetos chrysaetos TaxID=223781 RepID=A0A663E7H0_AQUCH
MLVSQQAIARAQNQLQNNTSVRPSVPTSTPAIRICAVQVTSLIGATLYASKIQYVCHVSLRLKSVNFSFQPAAATASVTTVTAVKPSSTGTPVKLPVTGPPAQAISQKAMLENVKKCKNFLATLIKLASSGPQAPEMGQNVKNLVQNLLEAKIEPEEFTKKLYIELKSSPQPYLVPFLKKSMLALRQLMPNAQSFIQQCMQQQVPTQEAVSTCTSAAPAPSIAVATSAGATTSIPVIKPVSASVTVTARPIIKPVLASTSGSVQTVKPVSSSAVVTASLRPAASALTTTTATSGQTAVQTVKPVFTSAVATSSLQSAKPVLVSAAASSATAPLQPSLKPAIGTPISIKISHRDEDDINDVTSMAGVSLNEENACILATNSELIGTVIRSCADEPFLSSEALQKMILNIGKRHDIMELNSDVVNLISHATQERLRGLLEKLTVIAQHRVSTHKGSDRYIVSSDTRAQLRFLEKLDHLEKQRKDEEEREMLLRAAKSRSNKEDPEQLRLKQKAKEIQQLELAQMQQKEANLTALAAIGPRKKRPLDSSNVGSGLEGLNGNGIAPGSSGFSLTKQLLCPRITRVCLRDLIFCMEQEREMKHSLTLYRALLK